MFHQRATGAVSQPTKPVFRAQNRKVSCARRICGRAVSSETRVAESRAESLVQELEVQVDSKSIRLQIGELESKLQEIDGTIDHAYANLLSSRNIESEEGETISIDSAVAMKKLARDEPQIAKLLLAEVQKEQPIEWAAFQAQVGRLKLARSATEQKVSDLKDLAVAMAAYEDPVEDSASDMSDDDGDGQRAAAFAALATKSVNIVMVTGIEAFNQRLYRTVAKKVKKVLPGVHVSVFSDSDVRGPAQGELEKAIADADVFFGSLVFDYDDVEWLKERVSRVPVRFVFESAIELMSETRVGEFEMKAPKGKKAGPPPAVKKVLELFGSGKEEDKLAGYLSFLKIGPKILKFIPVQKAQDLRAWLTVYGYWNEGGKDNVVEMVLYIVSRFFSSEPITPSPPVSTPPTGCLHPDYNGYFETPKQYMAWYAKHGALRGTGAPVAAVLLYRKHVVTGQNYIQQLVRQMECEGVIPVPIFLNGVEAHAVVRDQLTTAREQAAAAAGRVPGSRVGKDAAQVDVIVNTIGFPLVGGPAGTMEGGRQAEVACEILSSKNVPYMVTAPLLIQDLRSWTENGVAGLQSVVLYSLPELDGSVDTVPLGGLVGEDIYLIGERVTRLMNRIKKWTRLASTPAADRKLGLLLYGFPPGVGAVGTAALLNVPESLEQTLKALRDEGYDLGEDLPEDLSGVGEKIVSSLARLESPPVVARGAAAASKALTPAVSEFGAAVAATEVPPTSLRESLAFDDTWGPTEWGPIPFLPRSDMLSNNMEAAWGSLDKYRGLNSTSSGNLFVGGLQLGNVWIGVQPMLGVEGDPMRLLFDRDLTPHPQYAAFYRHLTHTFDADALIHFGMHGTVEWLPGSPLGNTGFSWSDVLMSSTPNMYIYAANNPSESIIAKRRGYGTIVSHNVPPYGRAGLYKQLMELQGLLQEYRDDPASNAALKVPIVSNIRRCGLEKDCPFTVKSPDGVVEVQDLTEDNVADIPQSDFEDYCSKLYGYLQEVSNRLFSEGLHTFGREPSPEELFKYLQAYLDGALPDSVVKVICNTASSQLRTLPSTIMQKHRDELHDSVGGSSDNPDHSAGSSDNPEVVEQLQASIMDAIQVRELLSRNTEELSSLTRALNGEYVLPQAGGDLLRDGPGVLPTGRNIHALDPYRMPSTAAFARGAAAGAAILEAHADANDGDLPETVAVNLWGLDSIKTRGDNVGLVLWLVGAQPVRESTGRIARFELIPLEELGRPRIDVLCNMSGIFRDSFQNVVELLDDMFQRAAAAEEPADMNLIRKHANELQESGEDFTAASSRLFSNPSGDYGSMVNERVGASNWSDSRDLGDTWASRNAFSYGRGEKGTARLPVLQSLLSTTDRVVQQIDSVEYGLTDIQEYYANTGALIAAAEGARADAGRSSKVSCSVVEAFGGEPKPAELDKILRVEYRSKLLNPKWAESMAAQGSGGAFEISQRMTAMLGWGATVFQEDWTWTQSAEMYVMDSDMANTLRSNNPEAFRNVVARMLEAAGRGIWDAPADTLQKLQDVYSDLDEQLEKVDTVN